MIIIIIIIISFKINNTAPNPEEDPEAQKAMEHLATLAAQVNYLLF